MSNIIETANALLERRLTKRDGPRLGESLRPLDNADAFAIQSAVSRLLYERTGEQVGGWKCLLPSPGKLVVGPIYRSTIHSQSPCPLPALKGCAVIEPEFAFVMGATLSPRATPYSPVEIVAAIGETRLALELIKSRYADPSQCEFPELLADGLFNQGLFLGPKIEGTAPAGLSIRLTTGGQARSLQGLHPNKDAYAPLFWLANFLREQGIALTEGQAVITGSYAGVLEVPFAEEIEVRYENLGTMRLEFVQLG